MSSVRDTARLAELNGAPPQLASAADLQAAGPNTRSTHEIQRSSKNPTRLNLRRVVEALEEEGLDPAVELIRVVKDPSMLEPDVRARFLNELVQYYAPKVKAVELSGPNGGAIPVAAISAEQAEKIAREYLIAQAANRTDEPG